MEKVYLITLFDKVTGKYHCTLNAVYKQKRLAEIQKEKLNKNFLCSIIEVDMYNDERYIY